MSFEIPKQPYSGVIGETVVGAGEGALKLGGEESYPFHIFEGKMPNPPLIAMEVWDYDPSEEWPAAAVEPFKDVISSPVAWAKKCVDEYGADIIVLQLKSIDPNGMDRSANEAAELAKRVSEAIDVPMVCWGTANNQKDEEVLKKISELCEGKNISLAPVEEGNHKGIGASALGYGQTIVSSSPIDVNLAKQLNILLGNLGVKKNKIIIDPTTGGLGYGMEYSYSVMERIRMAALTQEDDKLQIPMINNIGNEVWKSKEAGQGIDEAPTLGDPERRPILMETVASVCYLLAGSDVVIVRHPESARIIRSFIDLMINGGMASGVHGVSKKIDIPEADLISISPEPNLDFGGAEISSNAETEKVKRKAAAKSKKDEKRPTPKKEEMVVHKKPEQEPEPKVDKTDESKAEARVKAEEEARVKAEAETKAKAKEEARVKAKEEAEAKATMKAKESEALRELRNKRAQEREKHETDRRPLKNQDILKNPAKDQPDLVGRLIKNLDHIHKRN